MNAIPTTKPFVKVVIILGWVDLKGYTLIETGLS